MVHSSLAHQAFFVHIALKFNNKLINFFSFCLRILHGQQPCNDHGVIGYLHHIVVMTAEPTASTTAPSSLPWDAVPNFTVNNSWTIQTLQKTSLDLLDFRIQDFLCTINSDSAIE